MKVLIACEFSGIVRDEFTKLGHLAVSCDLLDAETPGHHIKGNVLDILDLGWDLMVAHPPCTYLATSGNSARRNPGRMEQELDAIEFFLKLYEAPIPRIALENPIGVIPGYFRPPDQYIQPYEFGHPETKRTCLWLKNLPKLTPTNIVTPNKDIDINRLNPTTFRWRLRSLTYPGIARAMAQQWSLACT